MHNERTVAVRATRAPHPNLTFNRTLNPLSHSCRCTYNAGSRPFRAQPRQTSFPSMSRFATVYRIPVSRSTSHSHRFTSTLFDRVTIDSVCRKKFKFYAMLCYAITSQVVERIDSSVVVHGTWRRGGVHP